MNGILFDTNNDIKIEKVSISIGNSDDQNAEMIIISEKGSFKEYPILGVGLLKFVKSTGKEKQMIREIKLQLSLDNINPKNIEYVDGQLKIAL